MWILIVYLFNIYLKTVYIDAMLPHLYRYAQPQIHIHTYF